MTPEPPATDRPLARGVTAELLARHDRNGPRYTSYPTAVEFSDGFSPGAYDRLLDEADRRDEMPLSVYVHLPFCEALCLFCGCNVIISPNREPARPYIDLLRREIEMVASRLPNRRTVSQLHLGGGTPTYHGPGELSDLLHHLFAFFSVSPGAELAVEVDPRVTTIEHLECLAELGFNRLSMGVQDFTPEVQHAVSRVQSEEETARIIKHARAIGFTGINVDLIYGLPHQRVDTFEQTLEATVRLRPDRVAVYAFAYVPWVKAHQRKLERDALPARHERFALFAAARERFLEAGYEPIGVDHFARPDDELTRARLEGRLDRNFQGYTIARAEDVVGLGISAIGDVSGAYVQNHKKLSTYRNAIRCDELPVARGLVRTHDDEIRRSIIHQLMCNFRVDVGAIERTHGIRFSEYFEHDLLRLERHARDGLVEIDDERITATPTGELFIRSLAMCFDRYWRETHEGGDRRVFSRTV